MLTVVSILNISVIYIKQWRSSKGRTLENDIEIQMFLPSQF